MGCDLAGEVVKPQVEGGIDCQKTYNISQQAGIRKVDIVMIIDHPVHLNYGENT